MSKTLNRALFHIITAGGDVVSIIRNSKGDLARFDVACDELHAAIATLKIAKMQAMQPSHALTEQERSALERSQ